MKLFLTIFAAIIAAAVSISVIALLVLYGDGNAIGVIAAMVGLATFPIIIDRVFARFGG